jgi:hypothetical protein
MIRIAHGDAGRETMAKKRARASTRKAVRRRGKDRVARFVCTELPQGSGHDLGGRSVAASLLVWDAAPETACGWGATLPWRVAQACVNSAPKNMIKAE